jgi:hypothetical protein
VIGTDILGLLTVTRKVLFLVDHSRVCVLQYCARHVVCVYIGDERICICVSLQFKYLF